MGNRKGEKVLLGAKLAQLFLHHRAKRGGTFCHILSSVILFLGYKVLLQNTGHLSQTNVLNFDAAFLKLKAQFAAQDKRRVTHQSEQKIACVWHQAKGCF